MDWGLLVTTRRVVKLWTTILNAKSKLKTPTLKFCLRAQNEHSVERTEACLFSFGGSY